MSKEGKLLVLHRIRILGQEACQIHHEFAKWREPALTDVEKTMLTVKLNNALEEQLKWINILDDVIDSEE